MTSVLDIPIEDFVKAYADTGLQPVYDKFGNGVDCGCPLVALAFTYGMVGPNKLPIGPLTYLKNKAGMAMPEMERFVAGVDGHTVGDEIGEYGYKVWEAVKP